MLYSNAGNILTLVLSPMSSKILALGKVGFFLYICPDVQIYFHPKKLKIRLLNWMGK